MTPEQIATKLWADYERDFIALPEELIGKIAEALRGAERDALERAAQWQPIETAPKDGVILLFKPDQRRSGASCFTGYWHDGGKGWMPCYGGYIVEPVTHWQPLPSPPDPSTGSGDARRLSKNHH